MNTPIGRLLTQAKLRYGCRMYAQGAAIRALRDRGLLAFARRSIDDALEHQAAAIALLSAALKIAESSSNHDALEWVLACIAYAVRPVDGETAESIGMRMW